MHARSEVHLHAVHQTHSPCFSCTPHQKAPHQPFALPRPRPCPGGTQRLSQTLCRPLPGPSNAVTPSDADSPPTSLHQQGSHLPPPPAPRALNLPCACFAPTMASPRGPTSRRNDKCGFAVISPRALRKTRDRETRYRGCSHSCSVIFNPMD